MVVVYHTFTFHVVVLFVHLILLSCIEHNPTALPSTVAVYVAPHALRDVLKDVAMVVGPDRRLVLARELTKARRWQHFLCPPCFLLITQQLQQFG